MCIHHKYPHWKSDNAVKGGDAFRILAMLIAVAIAFFCTLGQGIDSWICFGVYLGIGVLLWLWMVLVNWKKHPVEIEHPMASNSCKPSYSICFEGDDKICRSKKLKLRLLAD
ncbi:MAG: hypothetical protein V8T62_01245 [Oscillospiraceae bacterium]